MFFILFIYNYYSSNKNINTKNFNRLNIDQLLKEKITELPVLDNDTANVIEFNDSLKTEFENEKKRSFWNLLKNK
tara:strand:+ start:265 stop:489 length:225 start_codon:yes stop_codon:yes gene_type:complete